MMNSDTFAICLLTFLAVLVPYSFLSLWLNAPAAGGRGSYAGTPWFFRALHRVIDVLAGGIGSTLAAAQVDRARRKRAEALKAGYRLSAEQVYASQVLSASLFGTLVCFALFFVTSRGTLALGAGLAVASACWFLPEAAIRRRAYMRQIEIIRTLPFAIDLLTSAMRAGLDFIAAVRYYVTLGGKGALALEFKQLLQQMELGTSRSDALEEMALHVQTPEFTSFVAAVVHGTEIGASIIDTLQVQGEDMRRARFHLAERKAARAPALMIFPIALFILPSVFAIIIVPVILRYLSARGGVG